MKYGPLPPHAQPPTSPPTAPARNGSAAFGHSQDIGVDFALAARFKQNSQKNIAGCDTWTSHPATAELRKVRHDNFAPCDSHMSHLATSRHRTLRHRAIAPCGFRLSHPATQKPRFRPQNLAQLPPYHAHYIRYTRAWGVAFSSLDTSDIPGTLAKI